MNKDRQLDDFFGLNSEEPDKNHKEGIKETLLQKMGLKSKFRLLPKILSKRERYIIFSLLLIIAGSIISIPITTYRHFTKEVPDIGGSFDEGVIGEPRHINPLLSQTNDVDRDLVNLIYSGLLMYNEEGKLIPNLAKSYEVSSDGLNYTIYLRDNAKWHDGKPVTSDDIIFTIQTAQNTDFGSLQKINWFGVEIEKIDQLTIMFKLKNKHAQFLNNLTLGIMPKHLWENIKPINFGLSELNLKPIGSGPYKFKKLQKNKDGEVQLYELEVNKDFYNGQPNINKIKIKFYNSEDEMITAYNKNEIGNLSFISSKNLSKIKFKQRLSIQEIKMPRYFAVFLNQNQSKILSDKNIRLALSHATDKESLLDRILQGKGIEINSPMLAGILDIDKETIHYEYDKERVVSILDSAGWNKKNKNGIRIKGDDELSLKLTTSTWPELVEVAQAIKKQWSEFGIDIELDILSTPKLQQAIKERDYQMLLFGEILNMDPDPFSLWHSSQKKDPGLNLALYDNEVADTILEEARQTLNPLERKAEYNDFQKIVIEDIPAIFLYSPLYLYGQSNNIKGFGNQIIYTPSDRFINIGNWYAETKRIWR